MDIEKGVQQYFKRNISYVMFTVFLTIFALSLMLNLCYYTGCDIIPYWVDLVPDLQSLFGISMTVLILGIIFTEYIMK
ncbi:hypothetical protein [Methanococcus sp. CF]